MDMVLRALIGSSLLLCCGTGDSESEPVVARVECTTTASQEDKETMIERVATSGIMTGPSHDLGTVADVFAVGGLGGGNSQQHGKLRITFDKLQVQGSLEKETVAKRVATRRYALHACYQRELRRDPYLQGDIVTKLVIDATGRVNTIRVLSSTFLHDAVGKCVVGRMWHWRFPRSNGETVVVTPLFFRPG